MKSINNGKLTLLDTMTSDQVANFYTTIEMVKK